jgi:hypothetical protein
MSGLKGTGLLDRNRPAFERSIASKARCAAVAKRARESSLAHTKRIDRSSVFVPEPSVTTQTVECATFNSTCLCIIHVSLHCMPFLPSLYVNIVLYYITLHARPDAPPFRGANTLAVSPIHMLT